MDILTKLEIERAKIKTILDSCTPEELLEIEEQQKFYKRFYNWQKKGMEWTSFLQGALSERK